MESSVEQRHWVNSSIRSVHSQCDVGATAQQVVSFTQQVLKWPQTSTLTVMEAEKGDKKRRAAWRCTAKQGSVTPVCWLLQRSLLWWWVSAKPISNQTVLQPPIAVHCDWLFGWLLESLYPLFIVVMTKLLMSLNQGILETRPAWRSNERL